MKLENKDQDILYKPVDSWRYESSQNLKNKKAGTNHPGGVTIHYNLDSWDENDTLQFTVLDGDMNVIQEYSTHAEEKSLKLENIKAGAQTWNWNMKYADAKKFDGMIFWWGSLNGPPAVPGNYKIKMVHNGKELIQDFTIKANPTLPLSQADYQAQFDFIQSINNKVTESHEAIIEIREIKASLAKYKELVEDNESIVTEINAIDSTLNLIENELYQTKNQSRQDPLNFPIKLTNKLAHLNSLTQVGDFPPTDGAIEVRDVLVQRIDAQLEAYMNIRNSRIPALNEAIRSAQIDYIILKDKK